MEAAWDHLSRPAGLRRFSDLISGQGERGEGEAGREGFVQGSACSQSSLECLHKAVGIADLEEVTSVLHKRTAVHRGCLEMPEAELHRLRRLTGPVARVLQGSVGR